MSSDATSLSAFSGDVSEHPMYITLANIPRHLRHRASNEALLCVAFLPSMPDEIGDTLRSSEDFRLAKRRLMQDALRLVMGPLMAAAKG